VTLRIGIVGDRDTSLPNHRATEEALRHASAAGKPIEARWFATDELLREEVAADLASCAGVWCTTGSPYRSFEGALRGIRLARERGVAFLGTCGGFQHAVIEYARNVLGLGDAAHAEYEGVGDDALIAPLACSLAGGSFEVEMQAGSRAARCYGATRACEQYYCSYGIHPELHATLLERGLPIVGTGDDGEPRILELPDHPFFVATLFVPQARSRPGAPHPLVAGFLAAAAQLRS
jgi:CTP synthase (UTP-ammonia lyase)